MKFTFIFFFILLLIIISCSFKMNEKKIKKIEYYGLHGKVEANMANEIFSSKIGLYKAEYFDTNGNIIRESEFDKNNSEMKILALRFVSSKI